MRITTLKIPITGILFLSLLCCNLCSQAQINLDSSLFDKEDLRLISVGSSFTAGIKHGTVSNEAQTTSFARLVAQQMKVKEFNQATFPKIQNLAASTAEVDKTGVLRINFPNNSPIPDEYFGSMDDFSIPFLKVASLPLTLNGNKYRPESFSLQYEPYFERVIHTRDITYKDFLDQNIETADFFTYEMGSQDFLDYFEEGGYRQNVAFLNNGREGYFPENEIFNILESKGAQGGIILNLPEIYDLPYFNFYSLKDLEEKRGRALFIERYGKNDVRKVREEDRLLPNYPFIDELLYSEIGDISNAVPDEYVIGKEELYSVTNYNHLLASLSEGQKIPLVDIFSLYKKIQNGEYYTDDEIYVNATYPGGNFFSTDGITPTAFGNAVIANECIKVINSNYFSKIPLLTTSIYLD